MLRELQANLVGSLIVVPGIITAASKTSIKATKVVVKCTNCGHEKELSIKSGFGGVQIPRVCDNQRNPGLDKQQCKMDTYRIVAEKCTYIDQQTLKI
jgi:DNA replication licensing factor MCM5